MPVDDMWIVTANKGGSGKTTFSLLSTLYFSEEADKKVIAVDANFVNPNLYTVLKSVIETQQTYGKNEKCVDSNLPLTYWKREVTKNIQLIWLDEFYSLYKIDELYAFLDYILQNEDADVAIVDTQLNFPCFRPKDKLLSIPPRFLTLWVWSAGADELEMKLTWDTVNKFTQAYGDDYDRKHILYAFTVEPFVPRKLSPLLTHSFRGHHHLEGGKDLLKTLRKYEKKSRTLLSFNEFRDKIIASARKDFLAIPGGSSMLLKEEIPKIWMEVLQEFLDKSQTYPINLFCNPVIYYDLMLFLTDLILRRGKTLEDIIEAFDELYKQFIRFIHTYRNFLG
ncbi:MAG: hypothetical protein ACFFCD_04140 [Promethearchaeota archaeon]